MEADELKTSYYNTHAEDLPAWLDAHEKELTPDELYFYTLDAYSRAPFRSIPERHIIRLKRIRPADYLKDLDPRLKNEDPITIYRGGNNEDLKFAISWTTDLTTAIFFYGQRIKTQREVVDAWLKKIVETGQAQRSTQLEQTLKKKHLNDLGVFMATIRKDQIIATISKRLEAEVLQYGGACDIEEMNLTGEQIRQGLKNWNKRQRAYEDAIKKGILQTENYID